VGRTASWPDSRRALGASMKHRVAETGAKRRHRQERAVTVRHVRLPAR